MKCPLFYAMAWRLGERYTSEAVECFGDECAWWDVIMSRCVVPQAEVALENIARRLDDLITMLPGLLEGMGRR